MKTIKNYYIYTFISTFTRSIIDIYSVVYFNKQGINIKNIIMIYAIVYFLGYFISQLSLSIGSKIGYKYILILSSIITGIAFYIVKQTTNIYLLSLLLSLSIFTYHPIRHYYGLKLLKNKKSIGNILILIYLAQLVSSYIVIKEINLKYLLIISIISIIPAILIEKEQPSKNETINITNTKIKFFIFEQFRIIFILLEPLYLYLISYNLSYIGSFTIILTLSSIIFVHIFSSKININKNYRYINIAFVLLLILKLNIINKHLLLIIAVLEGVGIKANELISMINLYQGKNINYKYIAYCEKTFCITRSLILSIVYFLPISLKHILYLLIPGILCLSFIYSQKNTLI